MYTKIRELSNRGSPGPSYLELLITHALSFYYPQSRHVYTSKDELITLHK